MVGCVGNDIYGSELINSLRENNVSVENVNKRVPPQVSVSSRSLNQVTTAAPLSKALITLSVKMTSLSHSSKDSHWLFFSQKFRPPLLSILSALPAPTIAALSLITPRHGCLRPRPESGGLPVVNETEAAFMSGADVSSIDDAHSCATGLHKRVKGQVIITLGEKGRYCPGTWHSTFPGCILSGCC
ncbi:hypothetical protein M3O75_12260 [Klebsiella pneumoniae]|nr:hypothetical protein [Klebsiella pneumoniae]